MLYQTNNKQQTRMAGLTVEHRGGKVFVIFNNLTSNTWLDDDDMVDFPFMGMNMKNATQAFFYAKYFYDNNHVACGEIMRRDSPQEVKAYVGKVSFKKIAEWDSLYATVWENVLAAKFSVDHYAILLRATNCYTIVRVVSTEDNDDTLYGCFLSADGVMNGQNLHGNLLMKVRDSLIATALDARARASASASASAV